MSGFRVVSHSGLEGCGDLGRRLRAHVPAASRRGLVAAIDEQMNDGPHAPPRYIRIVDT